MFLETVIAVIQTSGALFSVISERLSHYVFYTVQLGSTPFPLIVLFFMITGIYFSIYFRLINVFGLPQAFRLLVQKSLAKSDTKGEVSHFQALTTALSGTVGLGSIGGVAVAVAVGGPGTLVWIILAGFLAMPIKMTECALGVMHRQTLADGSVAGGPMYFLEKGLKAYHWPRLGRFLGCFYALGILICAFGIGATFQSNQITHQLAFVMGWDLTSAGVLFGVGLSIAFVVALVILGGIKNIGRVAEKLVPFMIIFYLLTALMIIVWHVRALPQALALIWQDAWSLKSVSGGALGAVVIGFQRAIFTNEAGVGSAAIAHSVAKTSDPVDQGIISLMEPFLATIIVCSTTALLLTVTLILPGYELPTEAGVRLTSQAFSNHYPWLLYPLSLVIFLFGFTTILAWSYYGQIGWQYLFGFGGYHVKLYQLFFCCMVAIGGILSLQAVLQFSDALLFLISIPNLFGCFLFAHQLKPSLVQKIHPKNKVADVQTLDL